MDDVTHRLRRFEGDYDAYAHAKRAERAAWEEDYARQQDEIAALRRRMKETGRQVAHNRGPTDNDKFIYGFKGANVDRAVARNVRAAAEQLARIEADPVEKPPKPMRFQPRFRGERLHSRTILAAQGVSKALGGRSVLLDVTFNLGQGDRIVLVGPNGAGKTTLLRLLLGSEQPDAGIITRAPGVEVGYLPQEPLPIAPGQQRAGGVPRGPRRPRGDDRGEHPRQWPLSP